MIYAASSSGAGAWKYNNIYDNNNCWEICDCWPWKDLIQ